RLRRNHVPQRDLVHTLALLTVSAGNSLSRRGLSQPLPLGVGQRLHRHHELRRLHAGQHIRYLLLDRRLAHRLIINRAILSLRDETVILHQQRPIPINRHLAAGARCLIDPRVDIELIRGTAKVFNVHYGVSSPILLVSCGSSPEGWGGGARPGESALQPRPGHAGAAVNAVAPPAEPSIPWSVTGAARNLSIQVTGLDGGDNGGLDVAGAVRRLLRVVQQDAVDGNLVTHLPR